MNGLENALEWLKSIHHEHRVYLDSRRKEIETAIDGLKELEQYRTIGTVEECKVAREKMKPKKPDNIDYFDGRLRSADCPKCSAWIVPTLTEEEKEMNYEDIKFRHCPWCGQAILWEVET